MTELSCDQLQTMEEVFAFLDQDEDGLITITDFLETLNALGLKLTDFEKDNLLRHIRANEYEELDFSEFASLICKIRRDSDLIKETKRIFDIFDCDGNGFITFKEMHKVMKGFGEKVTKTEIKNMIKEIDLDGDGQINFEEFFIMMAGGNFQF